jgi:hypothetical protein
LPAAPDLVDGRGGEGTVHGGCLDAVPVRTCVEHCSAPPGIDDVIQFLALLGPQQLGEELSSAAATQRV